MNQRERNRKEWDHYIDRCWKAREYYKNEQNKLLYWTGTVFVAIIGVSGLFGATDKKLSVGFEHVLLFHLVFFVVWLYYLYKTLNCDMYDRMGRLAERHVQEVYSSKTLGVTPFFQAKSAYVLFRSHGDGRARRWSFARAKRDLQSLSPGRALSSIAGATIVLLYLILVTFPVWSGQVDLVGVSVAWAGPASIGIFIALMAAGFHLSKKAQRAMKRRVDAEFGKLKAGSVASSIEETPTMVTDTLILEPLRRQEEDGSEALEAQHDEGWYRPPPESIEVWILASTGFRAGA